MAGSRLVTSQGMEALVGALAESLQRSRPPGDVAAALRPVTILVPNNQTAQFVRIKLAERIGIAGNLDYRFFGDYFHEKLAERLPKVPIDGAAELQNRLLAALEDPTIYNDPALEPVRAYLTAADDVYARARLRFQFTQRMGMLFAEYGLSRPSLLETWGGGNLTYANQADFAETEGWQQRLWHALHRDEQTRPRLLVQEWLRWANENPKGLPAGDALRFPPELLVFGFSLLSPAYHALLDVAACESDVTIFMVDRWDAAVPAAEKDDPDAPVYPVDLWGEPGRTHLTLLEGRLKAKRETPAAPQPAQPSLLQALQHAERNRTAQPDGTLRFVSAPSLRREVEILADEIWRLVRDDEQAGQAGNPLRFHDIAVAVAGANADNYLTHIETVFTSLHELPFGVVDEPLRKKSRVVEAIELLAKLPVGRFTRRELLPLLVHPAVTSRFAEADPGQWVRWVDDLGILFYKDRSSLENSYIDDDRFNWDQGLRRLTLGAWMAGERSGVDACYKEDGQQYLLEDIGTGERPSAGRFILLVRSLIADAEFLRTQRHALRRWVEVLSAFFETYLAPENDYEWRAYWRCVNRLQNLAETDVTGVTLSYEAMLEQVLAALEDVRSAGSQFLTKGVAVGPIDALAGFPFRVIFVVGLGEGNFPARPAVDPLDLRIAETATGDVDKRRRDQFLFLQTLMAAHERLTLSWVGRDPGTGDDAEPSGLIRELEYVLEKTKLLTAEQVKQLTCKHPLNRYNARYYKDLNKDAGDQLPEPVASPWRAEAESRAMRKALLKHLDDQVLPAPEAFYGAVTGPQAEELRKRFKVPPPAIRKDKQPVIPLSIPLSSIRKFLEAPLQGWAAFSLGLEEDDDDLYREEDEPVALSTIEGTVLPRDAFAAAPNAVEKMQAALAERYDALELRGKAPTGFVKDHVLAEKNELLATWHAKLGDGAPEGTVRYQLGTAHTKLDRVVTRPALSLGVLEAGGGRYAVSVTGITDPTALDPETANGMISLLPLTSQKPAERHLLRGFFTGVILAAAGTLDDKTFSAQFVGTKEAKKIAFPRLSEESAKHYLRSVLAQMLARPHLYFLDEKTAITVLNPGARSKDCFADRVLASWKAQVNSNDPRSTIVHGSVRNPLRFPPPPDDVLREVLLECYGYYYTAQGKTPQLVEKSSVDGPDTEPAQPKPTTKNKPKGSQA